MNWISASIIGSSAILPPRKVSNQEVLGLCIAPNSQEAVGKIERQTGIVFRRYAAANEAASDLATFAVQPLLPLVGVSPGKLQALVVATTSPDFPSPATAHFVHRNLQLPQHVVCFDVASSCTSFLSALRAAIGFLQEEGDQVLVVAAEVKNTALGCDKRMRSLFGDGAAAVLVSKGTTIAKSSGGLQEAISFCYHKTRSELCDHIKIPVGGSRMPPSVENLAGWSLQMQDPKMLFRETVKEFLEAILSCWEARSKFLLDKGLLPHLVPGWIYVHQANARILEEVKQRLPGEISKRLPIYMADIGNTVCAALPILRSRVKLLVENSMGKSGIERVFVEDKSPDIGFATQIAQSEEFGHQKILQSGDQSVAVDIWVSAGGGFQTTGLLHCSI